MARQVSKSGAPIVADTAGWAKLARSLRRISPEAWKSYRTAARAVAEAVREDAKARAGFSSRIPQALKIRVTGGGNVKIVGSSNDAADIAAIENKGKGFVRHPVFIPRDELPGPPGRWTSKGSHPAFLGPAVEAHKAEIAEAMERAMRDAIERAMREE